MLDLPRASVVRIVGQVVGLVVLPMVGNSIGGVVQWAVVGVGWAVVWVVVSMSET